MPLSTFTPEFLEALPFALYMTDAEGRITSFNSAAAALWGRRPSLGEDRWCGAWRLYHPDGQPMAHVESPLAIALRENRDMRWSEAIAERPDGTRVPFHAFPTAFRDEAGHIVGAINTLVDLSDRQRQIEAQMHLAAIVESSTDAVISKDLNGIIRSWNTGAERLFGYSPEEAIGQSVLMLIPDNLRGEEPFILERIRRGEQIESYDTLRRRKDGSLVPISLTISPVRDVNGRIVGAAKIARDITSRRENEKSIRLLMREVNHRVKNQYAVILSMIRETRDRAKSPAEFERQLRERIMALSLSHDLLVSADWKGATVFDLIVAQLKPFGHEERVTLSGPPLRLSPSAVQYLGIAFHELATNSAKYGVLASSAGTLKVEWSIDLNADGSKRFVLAWRETGGPLHQPGNETGFGTVVLKRIAPQAVGGSATLNYKDGMLWTLTAPLSIVESSWQPDDQA